MGQILSNARPAFCSLTACKVFRPSCCIIVCCPRDAEYSRAERGRTGQSEDYVDAESMVTEADLVSEEQVGEFD